MTQGPFTSVESAFTWDAPGLRSSPWNATALGAALAEVVVVEAPIAPPAPSGALEPLAEYEALPGTPLAEVDLQQEALNAELLQYARQPFATWSTWHSYEALAVRLFLGPEPMPPEIEEGIFSVV